MNSSKCFVVLLLDQRSDLKSRFGIFSSRKFGSFSNENSFWTRTFRSTRQLKKKKTKTSKFSFLFSVDRKMVRRNSRRFTLSLERKRRSSVKIFSKFSFHIFFSVLFVEIWNLKVFFFEEIIAKTKRRLSSRIFFRIRWRLIYECEHVYLDVWNEFFVRFSTFQFDFFRNFIVHGTWSFSQWSIFIWIGHFLIWLCFTRFNFNESIDSKTSSIFDRHWNFRCDRWFLQSTWVLLTRNQGAKKFLQPWRSSDRNLIFDD